MEYPRIYFACGPVPMVDVVDIHEVDHVDVRAR
jgi:hypothetical protein